MSAILRNLETLPTASFQNRVAYSSTRPLLLSHPPPRPPSLTLNKKERRRKNKRGGERERETFNLISAPLPCSAKSSSWGDSYIRIHTCTNTHTQTTCARHSFIAIFPTGQCAKSLLPRGSVIIKPSRQLKFTLTVNDRHSDVYEVAKVPCTR